MTKYRQLNFQNKYFGGEVKQRNFPNYHMVAIDINNVLYNEEEYTRALSKKISVIDETLPFKDSMGFYTIDTKLKTRPVTTLVQSERDCDLWLKLMNTNSLFRFMFHDFTRNMLKKSREENKDRHVVLYYPDSKHGKRINEILNYFFDTSKK